MALGDNTGGHTFLNIKAGKISYKDKVTKEKKECGFVEGTITGVKFEEKEWEGKKYEQMSLTIIDGDEKYILQMKTDSGYFRAFCNCLRSGDPTKRVKLSPNYVEDGATKKSGMFVEQGGKTLPWYSKKDDPKDVPPAKAFEFKGKKMWDGTDQIEYWKKWLNGVKFESEFEASSLSQPPVSAPVNKTTSVAETESDTVVFDDGEESDLPF